MKIVEMVTMNKPNTAPSIAQVNKWVDEFERSYQSAIFNLRTCKDGLLAIDQISAPVRGKRAGIHRVIAALGVARATQHSSPDLFSALLGTINPNLVQWLEDHDLSLIPKRSQHVPDDYYTRLEIKRADLEAERLMHEQRKAAQEGLKKFDQLLGEHGEGLTAVYSVETGEMRVVHQIDADCYLRTGEWTSTRATLKADELPDELLERLAKLSQEALDDFDRRLGASG
jgi:hypothetical protein